jgi:glycosyltransferase involved in cell wall biosynthesis
MNPLLSIVVPTRNLQDMAMATVSQVLSIEAPDMEVVVRDSSDSDVLGRKLADLND